VTQIGKARFEPVPVKLTVNGQVCTIIVEPRKSHGGQRYRRRHARGISRRDTAVELAFTVAVQVAPGSNGVKLQAKFDAFKAGFQACTLTCPMTQ